jgi:site-specific recombinase XerC
MARHARGWTLRRRAASGVYLVRFSVRGRVVERSTGHRDRGLAEQAASTIYAHHISRETGPRGRRGVGSLKESVGKWIVSLQSTHDPATLATWKIYARAHWLPRWFGLHEVTTDALLVYRDERLRLVTAGTVRKELSALRIFLRWAGATVLVPSIGKRTVGKAFEKKRRGSAPHLSPADVERFLAELPEWSDTPRGGRYAVRARFVVAYETSLRPSTLDLLEVPTHYRAGASTLLITPEIDKARFGRELPLTQRARDALDSVAPDAGLIFGAHKHRFHVTAAAKAALPAEVASRFSAPHLRSARITHLLEQTGNVPGTQYLAGHKLMSTTAIYAKPSMRAAIDALGLGMPRNSGKAPKRADRKSR